MNLSLDVVLSAWDPAQPDAERAEWRLLLQRLLIVGGPGFSDRRALSVDRAWTLLGWCEEAASESIRERDAVLLEACTRGLLVLDADRAIDTRELLLVGSLIRRAVELLGLDWLRFQRGLASDAGQLLFLGRFPASVSGASHRESGSGSDFRFVRVPLATWSEEELLRRLSDGNRR